MKSFPLALVLLWPASSTAHAQAGSGAEPSEPCTPGVWEVVSRSYPPGGAVLSTRATSTVTCLLDGRIEVAEYRDLRPDGTVTFRGVSFHVWAPDMSERTTLWVMLGDPGHSILVERVEDGVLLSEGQGRDRGGTFLETSTTTFDEQGGYRFEMNRSYDEGATWRAPFNAIDAVRTAVEPELPAELTAATRDAKEAAGATSPGIPILDGLAEVEARSETVDGRTVRTVRFSVRYAQPDRWRTVVWELGELEITVAEQPLGVLPDPDGPGRQEAGTDRQKTEPERHPVDLELVDCQRFPA